MKQRKPMRRTAFRTKREGPAFHMEPKPRAEVTPSRALVRGTYSGGTTAAAPKTQAYRDPVLLEMARGRPCLLMVPAVCNHRVDTTAAAHSNLSIHGKAGARKADDCYSVWACASCHIPWLDQGKARAEDKAAAFMEGHARQVLAWRLVVLDAKEPERFRRAARRALEHLGARGIGSERMAILCAINERTEK